MKNPLIFWFLVVFTLVNLVDAITVYWILPGESNPLILLTGGTFIVMSLKFILIVGLWFLWYDNTYPGHMTYYSLILIIVVGTFLIGFAAYGNIQGIINPELVKASADIPVKEKIHAYNLFILFFYALPGIASMGVFFVYDKTVGRVNFKKKRLRDYFRKNPISFRPCVICGKSVQVPDNLQGKIICSSKSCFNKLNEDEI